ncbi:repressor protein [Vibrio cholerae]|nr:repressor protein [Vibrio cholerae]
MNKLKDFRNLVEATQKDIADFVGVSQSTIDRYESGSRKVSIEQARKLIAALNSFGAECTFDDVFPDPRVNSTALDKTA